MEKFPVPKETLSRIKSRSGVLLRTKSSSRGRSSNSSVPSSAPQNKARKRSVNSEDISREQSQIEKSASGSSIAKNVSSQAGSSRLLSAPPSKRLRSTVYPHTSSPSPPPPNPNALPARSPSPIPISTPLRARANPVGGTRSFMSDQHAFTSPFTFTTKEDKERARTRGLSAKGSAASSLPSSFAQLARSSPEVAARSRVTRQGSRVLRSGLIMRDDDGSGARKQRKGKKVQSTALPPADGQRTMCVWKSQGRGEIRITHADFYRTTLDEEYLNDTLIEFGLKESFQRATIRNPELADKVHIFNSFLYMKLTDPATLRKGLDPWETVKRWTLGKVDLFKKKYLVVPINENYHWYMAIIVDPRAIIPSSPLSPSSAEQAKDGKKKPDPAEAKSFSHATRRSTRRRKISDIEEVAEENAVEPENDDEKDTEVSEERTVSINDNGESLTRPYILLFDSFGTSRPQPGHVLTRYLRSEAAASGRLEDGEDIQPLIHRKADVPTQLDFSSCGVYLLHYADVFFSDPESAVQQILAQPAKKTARTRAGIESARDNFWRSTELDEKREDISNRILRIEADWKASQATDMEKQANEEAVEEEDTDIEEHDFPHSSSSSETIPDSIPMDYSLSVEPEGSQTVYEQMRLAFPSSAATTMVPGAMEDSVSSPNTIDLLSESRSGSSDLLKRHSLGIETAEKNLLETKTHSGRYRSREEQAISSTLQSHISPTPSPTRTPTSDHHLHPGQTEQKLSLLLSITRPSSPLISSGEAKSDDSTRSSRLRHKTSVSETTSDLILTLPSHLSPTPSPPPSILPLSPMKPDILSAGLAKSLSPEIIPSSVDDRPKFLLGDPRAELEDSKQGSIRTTDKLISNSALYAAIAPSLLATTSTPAPVSPYTIIDNDDHDVNDSTRSHRTSPTPQGERSKGSGPNTGLTGREKRRGRGRGKESWVSDSSKVVTPAMRRSTRSTND